jgi:cell shape-determining protein MreD
MKIAVLICALVYTGLVGISKFMFALFCAMALTTLNVLLFRDLFTNVTTKRKREAA